MVSLSTSGNITALAAENAFVLEPFWFLISFVFLVSFIFTFCIPVITITSSVLYVYNKTNTPAFTFVMLRRFHQIQILSTIEFIQIKIDDVRLLSTGLIYVQPGSVFLLFIQFYVYKLMFIFHIYMTLVSCSVQPNLG